MKSQAQKSPRATTKMSMKNYSGSVNVGNPGYSRPFVNFNNRDSNNSNGMIFSFQPQGNINSYNQFTPTSKTVCIPQNYQTNQFQAFNPHVYRSSVNKVNSF